MGAPSQFESLRSQSLQKDTLDIRDVAATLWRRKEIFLATFLSIASLVFLMTLRMTPIYTSTASVMIDLKKNNASDLQAVLSGSAPDSAIVDTEVEVIRSFVLAEKVAKKLDLTSDPEFNFKLGELGALDKIKSWARTVLPESLNESVEEQVMEASELEHTVGELLAHVSAYRKGTTYVINITTESTSPQKAANITNTFAEIYLLEQLDAKFEATSRANDWLVDRIETLKSEVRNNENAVESYRSRLGLLSAQGSSLVEQQISDLNAQLIVQRAEYNEAEARLSSVRDQIARGVPADTIGEVLSSSVIIDLRRQQAEVAGRNAELSSRYGARHPEVIKVTLEAADIQSQIDQEITRIISNLDNEVGIARQKVSAIESGLADRRAELINNNRSLVRLRELEREAEASRSLYESFLEKFKENDDQETITEPDARIISRAIPEINPASPNLPFNMAMGLIMGAAFGLAMVVLAELLDGGLSTGADVEKYVDLPFIAATPKADLGFMQKLKAFPRKARIPDDYISKNPLSIYSESIRTLRSSILLSTPTSLRPKVIAVTSALQGEGKTTLARSLGQISAMSGSKTIIVDCDSRLRQLSKGFGAQPKRGIVKYLKNGGSIDDVILHDHKTGCDYLLSHEDEYTHTDLYGSARFERLLGILRNRYDIVIIDTSPVLLVAETRTIANLADTVVLAARWRRTKADAVNTAKNILRDVQGKVIGVVLTQVNMKRRKKYGSGDYSYYVRQYGEYYSTERRETI